MVDMGEENGLAIDIDTEKGSAQSYVRLSVTEGKYRMVRRILHNSGHTVLRLHRWRYGGIKLDGETSIDDQDENRTGNPPL